MASHNDTGALGEKIAATFLVQQGLVIMARNWRFQRQELDLIAMDKNDLVFIEVKTRIAPIEDPLLAINKKKQKGMVVAAEAFIQKINFEGDSRFDVVSVQFNSNQTPEISHVKDAFYPSL